MWTREEIARAVEESRAAQGLPPKVEDPETLRKIAVLFSPREAAA